MRRVGLIIGCVLATWALDVGAQSPAPAGVVIVALRPAAVVQRGLVKVGDVADVQGGTAALRNKIAQLDLAVLTAVEPATALPRDQVSYRVQLAGIGARDFRMTGASQAVVRLERAGAKADNVVQASYVEPAGDASATTVPKEQPTLVKARDMVRLLARVGSFRVTALGEAQQDGRAGQLIRVRNVDSNRIISGRVVDQRVVEVDY
jgi:hypothetical protein